METCQDYSGLLIASKLVSDIMYNSFWFSPGARQTISANASGFSMDIILAVGPPVICLVWPSSNVLSSISNSGDTVSSSLLVVSTVLVDIPCAVLADDSKLIVVGSLSWGYHIKAYKVPL